MPASRAPRATTGSSDRSTQPGTDNANTLSAPIFRDSFDEQEMGRVYDRYFLSVQHENELVSRRLNVFLTISTLMFTGTTILIYLVHDVGIFNVIAHLDRSVFAGILDSRFFELNSEPLGLIDAVIKERYEGYFNFVDKQVRLLALLGILVSLIAYVPIKAAVHSTYLLQEGYSKALKDYKNSLSNQRDKVNCTDRYPYILGAGDVKLAAEGDAMPIYVTLLSAAVWVVLVMLGAEPLGFSELVNIQEQDPINEFAFDVIPYVFSVTVFYVFGRLNTALYRKSIAAVEHYKLGADVSASDAT